MEGEIQDPVASVAAVVLEVELELFDRVAGEMDELGSPGGVEELEKGANAEAVAVEALEPERLQTEDVAPAIKASHVHHYRFARHALNGR